MKYLKSILMMALSCIIAVSVFAFPVSADTSIAINSIKDLRNMENNPTANYHLANDIVVTEADGDFKPLFSATNQFKGVLDGQGHSIIGLNITSVKSSSGSSVYSGVFAYNSGTIKNLNFENANASSSNSKYAYTGIVAAINLGTIENCYVSGSSSNKNIGITAYTGGICGSMLKGEVVNSVSYVNVYSSGGEQYTGGILGYTEKGIVKQCAAFGSVFANGIKRTMDGYGGGIIGFSRAGTEITNCLFGGGIIVEKTSSAYIGGVSGLTYGKIDGFVSYGTITPSEVISHIYTGGVAGEDSSADVSNAYYLKGTINEKTTGRKGEELSEDQFKDTSSFAGFDFGSVWEMSNGVIKLKGLPEPSQKDVISKLTGIEIKDLPNKLKYVQGDSTLDLTGLNVYAIYTDKTVPLKQNEYTVGGYNFAVAGEQTITITYKGFNATFTVNVAKSNASVLIPSDVTDGAYQDGNQTGNIPTKKPANTTDKESESSKVASSSNSSNVASGNATIDPLEESTTNSETKDSSGNTDSDTTTIGAEIDEESSKSNIISVMSPLIIVIFIIIAIALVIAAIIWFILRSKSQTPQNEISNEELQEVELDENDVYNK